jgi:hypothetical protein
LLKLQLLQKVAVLLLFFSFVSCSKKEDRLGYAKQMLADKTWYLTSTTQENQIKSYIDKSTYSIQFKDSDKTMDSDGITGSYQVVEQDKLLQIIVTGMTQNNIPANYTYQIDHIEPTILKISYTQNSILIQKTFMTNR